MDIAEIQNRTREFFPELGAAHLRFDHVDKGGSGRLYYRVFEGEHPAGLIVMVYSDERSDNARFAPVTDFLLRQGVPVPTIQARIEEEGVLWVDDLGRTDLWELDGEGWEEIRRIAYEETLRSVFRLHQISETDPPEDLPELEQSFDKELYLWEQHYYFTHYVEHYGKERAASFRDHPDLLKIAEQLAGEPRTLLHRDFQSTNVLIRDGACYLIDYQGLRWGIPEYDLASMIYDPYVSLSEDEREHLIQFYFSLKESAGDTEPFSQFQERLYRSAIQRLMQALGAYGNLGRNLGKKEFLQHIPTAAKTLRYLAVEKGVAPILEHTLGDWEC